MNFNPRRRRSNLGRRYLNGDMPPPPVLPLAVPTFAASGLERTKSAKKVTSSHKKNFTLLNKASKGDYVARKKLFLKSPTEVNIQDWPQDRADQVTETSLVNNLSSSSNDLNITGINKINSPSPVNPKLLLTQHREAQVPKITSLDTYSISDGLEPPKSPGPSLYDQLIMRELADMKPPKDPGDFVNFKKYLSKMSPQPLQKHEKPSPFLLPRCTNAEQKSIFSDAESINSSFVHLKIEDCDKTSKADETINISWVQNKHENNNKKLSIIAEDLDTTNSFIWAEQTILEQNQTIINENHSPLHLDNSDLLGTNNTTVLKDKNTENMDSDDEELSQALEDIGYGLESMKHAMAKMTNLQTKVLRLLEKRKLKKNKKTEHKENIPCNGESKWFKTLKSGNPGLLKTPNISRCNPRASLMNQSSILTPHSLSTVLQEQIDELFE